VQFDAITSDLAPIDSEARNPWNDNISVTSTSSMGVDTALDAQRNEEGADGQPSPDRSQRDIAIGNRNGYRRDSLEKHEQELTDEEDSDSDSSESAWSSIDSDHFDMCSNNDTELIDKIMHDRRDDVSLYIKGLKIGDVKFRTDEIADGVIPAPAVRKLRRTKSEDPDKLWKTVVAERDEHGQNPPPWSERASKRCLPDPSPNGHINTKELLRKKQPPCVRKFLKRVQRVIWNRSFLEVNRGIPGDMLHGFGPGDVREGDIVCILFGCSVPCVLRKGLDTRTGDYYRFIGEAYLYGIMDGEEVTRRSDQEIEAAAEEFRLL
jgi:hypothetical protein